MKKTDVKIGSIYRVKVSGKLTEVKITGPGGHSGWYGKNLQTGKTVHIKSTQRLGKCLGDTATGTTISKEATQPATDETKHDTGERSAPGGDLQAGNTKPMSLLDAAAHILSFGTGDPMRCKDIVDLVVTRNLWTPRTGKTPASTLNAAIAREIATKGEAARFVKAERGKYALKDSQYVCEQATSQK